VDNRFPCAKQLMGLRARVESHPVVESDGTILVPVVVEEWSRNPHRPGVSSRNLREY
jgi:hypothetical protein